MSSPPGGGQLEARGRARAPSDGSTSSEASGSPPYTQRRPSSAARSPEAISRSVRPSSGSKSTSQIHETSLPSAIASFSATSSSEGAPPCQQRVDDLVRTRRVLDQQHEDRLVARRDPLEAAEGGAEPLERRRGSRRATRRGTWASGGCPERVVDVVEAGKRQPEAGRRPRASRAGTRRRRSPSSSISRRAHMERRPSVAAGRAAVVAEMADVRGRELVRLPAADAVARVGSVLERAAGRVRGSSIP